MKWNQFLGGVLVGAAFGIMVGVAVAPGSGPDKVTTSTAGFCTILAITGVAAAFRRSRLKGTGKDPAADAGGTGIEDKNPPARSPQTRE
jgi:hypothetical protein